MRVVVIEDSVLLREGMTRLLEERGFEIVAALGETTGALDLVIDQSPDVVITDIKMPPSHTDEGLRLAEEIKVRAPSTGVLVLSQYVEPRYALGLMKVGQGVGYLLKDRVARLEVLLDAIQRVAAGGSVVDSEVVGTLKARGRSKLSVLTEREKEILGLIAEGMSNRAIREALFITRKTLETHIGNIFTKLDLPPESEGHRRVLAVLAYLRS